MSLLINNSQSVLNIGNTSPICQSPSSIGRDEYALNLLKDRPYLKFIRGHSDFAMVVENKNTNQCGLFSILSFKKDDNITSFGYFNIQPNPTYLTVQIGHDKHINLDPDDLHFINHSCDPNVFFDTTNFKIIALKDIIAGNEFTFFYPSTEWKMAQSFDCLCNSSKCLHKIQGAYYIDHNTIANYRLSDFIHANIYDRDYW